MRDIGFTATRRGMTPPQALKVDLLIKEFITQGVQVAHHGMCVGGDAEFHVLARKAKLYMEGHPGVDKQGKVTQRAPVVCDSYWPSKYFLLRNPEIVDASQVMLAAPAQKQEKLRGSGTWATIRYARRVCKPLVIVYPDGTLHFEYVHTTPYLHYLQTGHPDPRD